MKVGNHSNNCKRTWKLGELSIEETTEYKYLGDIITSDGKNSQNLRSRNAKLQATTVTINTIASSEVLHKIETSVLLELHDKISISGLLTNAESWNLNRSEEDEIEKMEIQAVKKIYLIYHCIRPPWQPSTPLDCCTQYNELTKRSHNL